MLMRFLQRVNFALQSSFGILCDLAPLLDRGDFAVELDLHSAECGFKSVRIFRLNLVDKANDAIMVIEVLAGTLQAAPFADDLRFEALIGHVC